MRIAVSALVLLSLLVPQSIAQEAPLKTQQPSLAMAGPHQSFPHSPLATGNGFGFAVVDATGDVTRLYAHPYRFERANEDKTKDGYTTANFLKTMSWDSASGHVTAAPTQASYIDQSQVISIKKNGCEMMYFMPFGLARNALIATRLPLASCRDISSCLRPTWLHAVEQQKTVETNGRRVFLLKFSDVKELLAIVPLSNIASDTITPECLPGNGWAFVTLESDSELNHVVQDIVSWQDASGPEALAFKEVTALEKWRVDPPDGLSTDERRLWRQSETILRMAQIRQPNTSSSFSQGLILASLPDGVWFTAWVRDMSYAVVALIRMGHLAEARAALLAYLNARPVGLWKQDTRGLDYQISVVRYYGDGSEESDYSGQTTENLEFDDWGLVLWALDEYFKKTNDYAWLSTPTYRGTVYQNVRDYIVKPLLGNLDPYGGGLIVAEDSSLWEEHQANKRHYAFSTIVAIRGLRGFLPMAQAMHDEKSVKLVDDNLKALQKGYNSAFVRDGVLWGSLETSFKNEIDGSSLEAFNFDVVTDPSIINKTLEKMSLLKTPSGGYRRVRGDTEYEKPEFLFVDFYMARLYLKLGRPADAMRILNPIVHKALDDNGLIPEMYVCTKGGFYPGEVGDPTGANPMVGYGAGAYVITTLDRSKTGSH